jgi:hypothetical protein
MPHRSQSRRPLRIASILQRCEETPVKEEFAPPIDSSCEFQKHGPTRRITSAKRSDNAVQAHYDCPSKKGKRIPIAKICNHRRLRGHQHDRKALSQTITDQQVRRSRSGWTCIAACVSQRADSSVERMPVIASPRAIQVTRPWKHPRQTKPAPSALR